MQSQTKGRQLKTKKLTELPLTFQIGLHVKLHLSIVGTNIQEEKFHLNNQKINIQREVKLNSDSRKSIRKINFFISPEF